MVKRVSAVENLLVHTFGDEAVVLNLNTETYYTFNGVGMKMWQVLTTSPSIDDALQALQAEYEVTEDVLRTDMDEFIDHLHDLKLIEIHEV